MSQPITKQPGQARPPGSTVAAGSTTESTARSSGAVSQAESPGAGPAAGKDSQTKTDQAARSVENQATAASEQIKRQADEVVHAVTEKTYQAAERARRSGRQYADEKKQLLAEEIDVFSGAIRKASAKLHEDEHASIASYLDAAVEQLDDVREALQQKSVGELLEDAGRLARRRPELVYGGMFLAGLAAVRFLKASDRKRLGGYERATVETPPPVPGASRPISSYPQTSTESTIHRAAGFPNPSADSPFQPTSTGEMR